MTINYEIGKPRADKRMRITLMLCVGKSKKRIKTDLFVMQADLNRKGKIKNDSPIYKKVRDKIQKVETEYRSLDTFLTGERITASTAVERMQHSDIPSFFTFADKWLEHATMKGKKNYESALRNFRAFTKADIQFSMFSHALLNDYLYSLKDKRRAQSLYLNVIKRIYTDAEKDYKIAPFSSFRFDVPRQQRADNRALSIKEIQKIFSWKGCGIRANLARDCVVLSFCLCGTNSTDLFNAPPIRNNTLSYNRMKTKDRRIDNAHIELKIPKQIRGIVKKYKDSTRAFSFHKRFTDEASFNRSINIGLKDIRDELKMKDFSFYAFRHSWATIARNDLRIDKYLVHDCLNHIDNDTAIDDIYIKKDFTLINEANQKVVDYVLNGKSPLI